ncbi:MAG: AAA family ATPase [Candidatus Omnitrophica bacterium]|nr:AAA family ATPase [Candidatus Omnitrophota bacterium]
MKKRDNSGLRFPEVVVVEASAGSGKTFALAKRYLQLLFDLPPQSVSLRGILAITFTNKATVEMKERILFLLKKIALGLQSPEIADVLAACGIDRETAQERAARIMEEIMRHYNFFQVKTIDSFINSLLLGCALHIDRSAHFQIKRDYADFFEYCLDWAIEQAASDEELAHFWEEFLRHYLFVENRKGWFPKKDIQGLMISLFQISNKYGGILAEYPGTTDELIQAKKAVFAEIREFAARMPEGLHKSAANSILKFVDENDPLFEISQLPARFRNSRMPLRKGTESVPEAARQWEKIHRRLRPIVEKEAEVSYTPYIRLFRYLLAVFQQVSRKEDVVFLQELNRKARALFQDGITVAEMYYRLAARFTHYLIDEFQDTSILQWQNLEIMVEEALSRGGTLFYVGDKKQAIYRFRGGEAALFERVKRRFSHFGVRQRRLARNWRSHEEIVKFNNRVFSSENLRRMLEESGIAKEIGPGSVSEVLSVFHDPLQAWRPEAAGGRVCIEKIEEKNKHEYYEILQERLPDRIEALTGGGYRREDIAVLLRDNEEVEQVTLWLVERGIPVESEKTLNVAENPYIREIVSLLKFLHSPLDDLYFASFLIGALLPAAAGIPGHAMRDFLFSLHREGNMGEGISLYRWFRRSYPELWERYFEEFFRSVGFISPYELVRSIYSRYDVMSRFPDQHAFFMKFLELVKSGEEDHVGLGEFLAYLDDLPSEDAYVHTAQRNAVRVLTIHKAKGLEFPVVIMPAVKMNISPETGGRGTNSHVEEGADTFGLLRITKAYREYSGRLQEVYARDYAKSVIDELNSIYVGFTRAKEELYLFLPRKAGPGGNKARWLIPDDLRQCGGDTPRRAARGEEPRLVELEPVAAAQWYKPLREEFRSIPHPREQRKVRRGLVAHALLAGIGNLAGKDPREEIPAAVEKLQGPVDPQLRGECERLVRRLIDDPGLRGFFTVPEGEVWCEKEICNRFGDTKRIDRLVVTPSQALIIDYKSSVDRYASQQAQVREYMDLVKEIYPRRDVRGVLISLETGEKEEVKP